MTPYNVALGCPRAFIAVPVLLHRSCLAYVSIGRFDVQHDLASTAPIVDTWRWCGFDMWGAVAALRSIPALARVL